MQLTYLVNQMASFVSEYELKKVRNTKKRQQYEALETAKKKFEEKQKYKRYKKASGQDKWMLSSLNERLKKEEHVSKQHKKRKHKKKKKSHRSSSSSSDGEAAKDVWVEASSKILQNQQNEDVPHDFLAGVKTYSADEVRSERNSKRNNQQGPKTLSTIEQHGQHEKELNPFWKSGDSGLPSAHSTKPIMIQDASWLRRSLVRMQEQSKETGKPVEEIAKDRYGSWDAFKMMLNRAEGKPSETSHHENSKSRFLRPSDDTAENSQSRRSNKYVPKHSKSQGWKKGKESSRVMNTDASTSSTKKPPHSRVDDMFPKIEKESQSSCSPQTSDAGGNKSVMKHGAQSTCEKILSEQEKNVISAKIIKAELMGKTELAQKLKKKLEASHYLEKLEKSKVLVETVNQTAVATENSTSDSEDSGTETVVLSRTSKTGQSWPVIKSEEYNANLKKMNKKKAKVHTKDGMREKYFDDDDRYTLKDLVEREKTGAAEDQTQVLSRLSSKLFRGVDGENITLDDMFVSQASQKTSIGLEEARNEQRAIFNHQRLMRRLEKCKFCFGNSENPKHLIVAIGKAAYLRLPSYRPLQPGHCLIVPLHHCVTGTSLDENVWDEIKKFMQSLQRMYTENHSDGVFLQTCMSLQRSYHFVIECIPLPTELGNMAPMYFKKAIQECDSEWSQNKKLVDTRGSSVRSKIPAGLPYFAVDFGLDGGFAHVIEDATLFPLYFGREVLGGMLDAEPQLWRKPHEERFNEQMKRAVEFEKMWKQHDWTLTELG